MYSSRMIQPPITTRRCSICYDYYECLLDRIYMRLGKRYHFNNICLLCNDILEKAFMINRQF